MRIKQLLLAGLGVLCLAAPAYAAPRQAAFDPLNEKDGIPGRPTEVLVLGTFHLSETADSFHGAWMAPLIDRLAAWKPQVITTESLSGESCTTLAAYGATYGDAAGSYCGRILTVAALAQTATGLTMPAAYARAETLLSKWPAAPTPAQRRELAAAFAAAGDLDSAMVQWARLPVPEHRIGDGVDAPLLAAFTKYAGHKNEDTMLAVPLAARLGLERVYPADDHTADRIMAGMGAACEAEIQAVWGKIDDPQVTEMRRLQAAMADGDSLLAYYRFINTPKMQLTYIGIDQLANMRTPSPTQCGRQYMAWWEVRNLRMVANIRATFGNQPGVRVLSIVGASHKPYFDTYLEEMHEVRLVKVEDVLK